MITITQHARMQPQQFFLQDMNRAQVFAALRHLRQQEQKILVLSHQDALQIFLLKDIASIAHVDDIPATRPGVAGASVQHKAAWSLPYYGGHFLQLDYECPVGIWSANKENAQENGFVVELSGSYFFKENTVQIYAEDQHEYEFLAQKWTELSLPEKIQSTKQNIHFSEDWSAEAYDIKIEQIKNYIAAGDMYQCNFTQAWHCDLEDAQQDLDCFEYLVENSPAGFASYMYFGEKCIVSHSPELFFLQRGNRVISEPIKGTLSREALSAKEKLLNSEKDLAELTMIVDLVRNDFGRIAQQGTVRCTAPQLMELPYVFHLYGSIEAELSQDIEVENSVREIMRASFPPGSITGAPKIRSMEIIQELEKAPRGAYCGCFGWYASQQGQSHADFAVAIRTMQAQGKKLQFHAGGGIVADSQADAERQEMQAKASAMKSSVLSLHKNSSASSS